MERDQSKYGASFSGRKSPFYLEQDNYIHRLFSTLVEDILLEADSLVLVLEVHILRCQLRWCNLIDENLNNKDDFNLMKRILLFRMYSQYLPTPPLSQQSALLAPLAQPFVKDQNRSIIFVRDKFKI